MNAINVLKKDHREVEAMLKKIERGNIGARERQKLVTNVIRELAKHSTAEEQVVYPLARKRLAKLESEVLLSLEEHHIMKVTLAELQHMKPTDERFLAKIQVLATEVRSHVKEEEEVLLPALEKALTQGELANLGDMIERAKKVAPTRPHPIAPDTPPGNLVAGVGAAIFDRARDAGRDAISKVVRRGSSTTSNGGGRARGTSSGRSTTTSARGRSASARSAHAR